MARHANMPMIDRSPVPECTASHPVSLQLTDGSRSTLPPPVHNSHCFRSSSLPPPPIPALRSIFLLSGCALHSRYLPIYQGVPFRFLLTHPEASEYQGRTCLHTCTSRNSCNPCTRRAVYFPWFQYASSSVRIWPSHP